jgi:hypothetical protein
MNKPYSKANQQQVYNHFSQCCEWLRYDKESGDFWWIQSPPNTTLIGQKAGAVNNGYIELTFNLRKIFAHRLAWFIIYGYIPKCIEHKDRNTLNNAIDNLIESTRQNVGHNKTEPQINNTSGFRGVYYHKKNRTWFSSVKVNKRSIYLGTFENAQLASDAYEQAKLQYRTLEVKLD